MRSVVITLREDLLIEGTVGVTKTDEKGARSGYMSLDGFSARMRDLFDWTSTKRLAQSFSRFDRTIEIRQLGSHWTAVRELPPDDYFLVSLSRTAYKARLPRLVVVVSSGTSRRPRIFWARDEVLTPASILYPLMISNIDSQGEVCLGTTGLRCKSPDDIDKYIRLIIEAPADGAYLSQRTNLDKLYAALAKKWATGIGRRHPITLGRLLESIR